MSKIAIVYWSSTGNTESMAKEIANGVNSNGGESHLFEASEFNEKMIDKYTAIAFGCPAMGAEELEESEFEPMFDNCLSKLNNKKIALFGSYGWGDGEWMRNWKDNCINSGCELVEEPIICNDSPDDEVIANCQNLGNLLAEL